MFTVWQFQNLYTTQILREIYFWACKSSKNAIFAFLDALNLEQNEIFAILEAKIARNGTF